MLFLRWYEIQNCMTQVEMIIKKKKITEIMFNLYADKFFFSFLYAGTKGKYDPSSLRANATF